MIARRSVITGLVALVAAPAIVKLSSLMPVNAALQPETPMQEYVRRVLDPMINEMATHQADAFGYMMSAHADGVSMRRISNYEAYEPVAQVDVLYGQTFYGIYKGRVVEHTRRTIEPVPAALGPLALAAAAVAVAPALLEKLVTRRFWAK